MTAGLTKEQRRSLPVNIARKNIYVPIRKWETVWEPARQKWGGYMSPLIMRLLEAYVEGRVDIKPEVEEDR